MVTSSEIVLRLALAALLGSIVGVERERLAWAAGLRTHMLVCVGSTLIMIVSAFAFTDALGQSHVELDPSRVAAQVVSGIGFLGAGTILLRGEFVRGLTTAASLWTVAAVGLAVEGGLYMAAVSATILILIILAGIRPIERRFWKKQSPAMLNLVVERSSLSLADIEVALANVGVAVSRIVIREGAKQEENKVELLLQQPSAADSRSAMEQLSRLPGVRAIALDERQR
jgi:putative Mg2+ transporter-C (MgtC) family protein